MSTSDDPVIAYDPDRRVVTIDGFRFSREFFSFITASPPGIRFRIVERKNGVITVAQDRDPLETAAPELLAAVKATEALDDRGDCPECEGDGEPEACRLCFPKADDARLKRRAAIAKAEGIL